MSDATIGLNDYVMLKKGDTIVSGIVDGMKLNRGELETLSIENLHWFRLDEGWLLVEEADDAEIQPE